jgi:hypothetical protein
MLRRAAPEVQEPHPSSVNIWKTCIPFSLAVQYLYTALAIVHNS